MYNRVEQELAICVMLCYGGKFNRYVLLSKGPRLEKGNITFTTGRDNTAQNHASVKEGTYERALV